MVSIKPKLSITRLYHYLINHPSGYSATKLLILSFLTLKWLSTSDVTMSLSVAGWAVLPHLAHAMARPGFVPLVAPQLSPIMGQLSGTPHVFTQVGAPPVATPSPVAQVTCPVEPLKLCKLKDAKATHQKFQVDSILPPCPEILHGPCGWCSDHWFVQSGHELHVGRAALACCWRWQPSVSLQEQSNLYNCHGFEMLAALTQHYHPNSVANAFTSLLLLFDNMQGNDKPILQCWSCFDGIIMELSCCKILIPQILLVMLFLRAIHSHYSDLLEQFCTCFKSMKTATIDSIIGNI